MRIPVTHRSSAGKWIAAIVVVLIIVAAGVWWSGRRTGPAPASPLTAPAAPASSAPAAPQHPISQARAALPEPAVSVPPAPVDTSDAGVTDSLSALVNDASLQRLLVKTDVIQRIVATVNALPHREFGRNILPVRAPSGLFVTAQSGGKTVIGTDNAARYAPYMNWIEHADSDALVAWYVRHYPAFQKAYQQLGYSNAYFNDRLIAVINHLLATPTPTKPVALTQPHVLYEFVDPAFESLSAGQKMLLRVGPANEARIKAKLRAIRDALTGAALPPAPASSAAQGVASAAVAQ